jgi:hypothetical protein
VTTTTFERANLPAYVEAPAGEDPDADAIIVELLMAGLTATEYESPCVHR